MEVLPFILTSGNAIFKRNNMSEFKDLKKIVAKLKEHELSYDSTFSRSKNLQPTLNFKLLHYLLKNPNCDQQQAELFLYGVKKEAAFIQLVHRTKERLLDILISSDCIENNKDYSDSTRMILILRKNIIQFDILNSRGLLDVGDKLIKKVIQKARVLESYDTLILALNSRLRVSFVYLTPTQYVKFCEEINFYEDCHRCLQKSRYYVRKHVESISSLESTLTRNQEIGKLVSEVEDDFNRLGSKKILLCLLQLKAELYEIREDYVSSYDAKSQYISLISNYEFLYSKEAMGAALVNLGVAQIQLLKIFESTNTFNSAFIYINKFEISRFVVNKYQFLANFYLGDTRQTEQLIDLLNTYLYSGIIVNFFADEVRYYNACIKFILGEYNASYLLLQNTRELERNKESWNVAIRVMGIMNQIESENYELADSLVENLRKHSERLKKNLFISSRDEVIVQVLLALSRHSYNFRKTYRLRQESFRKLESRQGPYRWKILNPEMIIFHEWFHAKLNGQRYRHFEKIPEWIQSYASAMETTNESRRKESLLS